MGLAAIETNTGGIRRVLFKDYFYNADGDAPKWTEDNIGASIAISSEKYLLQGYTGVGGQDCRTHVTRTVTQNNELFFDVSWELGTNRDAGYNTGIFIMASANSGAGYGNSYYIYASTNGICIDEVASDVFTNRANTAYTWTAGTTYYICVHYVPSTGVITVYVDEVSKVTWTDASALTSGSYVAVKSEGVDTNFSKMRVRRPFMSYISFNAKQAMTVETGSIEVHIVRPLDTNYDDIEWLIGKDGIEVLLDDGTTVTEWGDFRLEDIEEDPEKGRMRLSGRDWLSELIMAQDLHNANADIETTLKTILTTEGAEMGETGIDATGETAVARDTSGKTAFQLFQELAEEAGAEMWQDFFRRLRVTSAFTASGITIDLSTSTSKVVKWKLVNDSRTMVNDVDIHYSGPASTNVTDATKISSFGKHTMVMVDTEIPNVTQAQARGNYYLDRYKSSVKVIDIWCSDYHELQRGDTFTLNIPSLDLNNATMLVIEAEVDSDDFLRFRCSEYSGTAQARHLTKLRHMLGHIDNRARTSQSMQL